MLEGAILRRTIYPYDNIVLLYKVDGSGTDGIPTIWKVFSLQQAAIEAHYERELDGIFWECVE